MLEQILTIEYTLGDIHCEINKYAVLTITDNKDDVLVQSNLSIDEYQWDVNVNEIETMELNSKKNKVIIISKVNIARILYIADLEENSLACYGNIGNCKSNFILNCDNDYIVYCTNPYYLDTYSQIYDINSKQYNYVRLINFDTGETITLDSYLNSMYAVNLNAVDENTIEYYKNDNKTVLKINDYIGGKRVKVRNQIISYLLEHDTEENYKNKTLELADTYYVNNRYYQVVKLMNGEIVNWYQLWQYDESNNSYNMVLQGEKLECYVINEKLYASWTMLRNTNFVMINDLTNVTLSTLVTDILAISSNNEYMTISDTNGYIEVYDKSNNYVMGLNVFDDLIDGFDKISEVNKIPYYQNSGLSIEHVFWDINSENIIAFIKDNKTNLLRDIKVINIKDKTSKPIKYSINCNYDEFYYDVENSFIIFSSSNEYNSDGSSNTTKSLYLYAYNIIKNKLIQINNGDFVKYNFLYYPMVVKAT